MAPGAPRWIHIVAMWIGALAVFAIFLWQFATSPPTWILWGFIVVTPFSIRAQRRSWLDFGAQSDL